MNSEEEDGISETHYSFLVTLQQHQNDSRGMKFCDICQKSCYRSKIEMQFLQKSEMAP